VTGAPVIALAREWLADDPDPATVAELEAIVTAAESGDGAAAADLADRFGGFLEFGTAGLRGAIGAGPMRMNRAVVIRAAAGLAAYLADALSSAGHERRARVVIGFDARHRSADFAHDTTAVMHAAGHEALIMPSALPTPLVAYAVRALGADAGVMVTASHNPPQDNGYKVYLGGRIVTDGGQGAQIVPPYDALIAAKIAAVPSVASVSRAESGWTTLGHDIVDDYVAAAASIVPPAAGDVAERRAATRIVLTSLHGVGGETLVAALTAAGFTDLHPVAEQAEPDPDFPTVSFPNPEEKGAIDLALELARQVSPDVVIANDPDADRCAMAAIVDGEWTMLHGDVVGSLLGEHIAAAYRSLDPHAPTRVLANSIVSSRQLAAIAARHGLVHRATLTGFKWIAREEGILFGYEEALGLCVAPELVADKDGITAAVLIAELTSELKAAGRDPAAAIDDLARAYGVYLTRQVSARFADASLIPGVMAGLLASPPSTLGGASIDSADDMNAGIDGLPPTNGLRLMTATGSRVIIRPSGTEPKVKAYLEVIEDVDQADVAGARRRAAETLDRLEADVRTALGLD
jgi:phosphomannomutase